jgi:hypothetical protein
MKLRGDKLDCSFKTQTSKTLVAADALFEPGYGFNREAALLIDDGKIVAIDNARKLTDLNPNVNVADINGCIILPKFFDHHLHIYSGDRESLAKVYAELTACGIGKICLAGSKNERVCELSSSITTETISATQYQQDIWPGSRRANESIDAVQAQQVDKQDSWAADDATRAVPQDSKLTDETTDNNSCEPNKQWKSPLSVENAGQAIYKKGSYGSFLGIPIESVNEAGAIIDKMLASGIDFLKIITSGIFDPHKNAVTKGSFSERELKSIIKYAKASGLPVHCHANGDEIIRTCVEAGADVIVHGFFVSERILSLMTETGTALIPTIAALSLLKHAYSDIESVHAIDEMVTKHMATVKKASEIGVRILAGSDAGASFIPYGTAFLDELHMLRLAGLPVETILNGSVGDSLKSGDKAEFVILENAQDFSSFSTSRSGIKLFPFTV